MVACMVSKAGMGMKGPGPAGKPHIIGCIWGIMSDMLAARFGLKFIGSLKRLFFFISLRLLVLLEEWGRFLLALPDDDMTPAW